jgi:transposase, IS5 family
VIADLHRRLGELAREKDVIAGRKMRVDTTVVKTNIHYPTESVCSATARVSFTRTMKKD